MNEEMMQEMEIDESGDGLDLSDDDIAAALGYATTLSEPLIPMDEMSVAEGEAEEMPEEEQPAEQAPEEPQEPMEEPQEEQTVNDAQAEEIRALWQEIGKLKAEKE